MVVHDILNWKMIDFVAFFQSVEDYLDDILPHYIPKDEVKIMYIGSLAKAVGTIYTQSFRLKETRIRNNEDLLEHFGTVYFTLSDAIRKIENKQFDGLTSQLCIFFDEIKTINALLLEAWGKPKITN